MSESIARTNYQLFQGFLAYLERVYLVSLQTQARYKSYLRLLLLWSGSAIFEQANEIEPTFPQFLVAHAGQSSQEPLSASTLRKATQLARRFFTWARTAYPARFRGIDPNWIATIRMPDRELNRQPTEHTFITLEEVSSLVQNHGHQDHWDLLRDQAAAALLFLSGARPGAFATLPICAVDLGARSIKQWPKLGVHTKFSKSATTYLLDVPNLLEVAQRWDDFIRPRLPETAMWYTPITNRWGDYILSAAPPGAHRSEALAERMSLLFALAGLAYKSPHKFRHGHAVFALLHARDMADYKAISQNLMHSTVEVTDGIYAPLCLNEVQSRISQLVRPGVAPTSPDRDLTALLESLSRADQAKALMILAARLAGS